MYCKILKFFVSIFFFIQIKCLKSVRHYTTTSKIKAYLKLNESLYNKNGKVYILFPIIILFPLLCIYIGYVLSQKLIGSSLDITFPDEGVIVDGSNLNYSWFNSHNLTIKFIGGIGNTLFQYAALFGIAQANGMKLVLEEKKELDETFNGINGLKKIFPNLECVIEKNKEEINKINNRNEYLWFVERRSNTFDQKVFSLNFMHNLRLVGFFQSWRYWDHVRGHIKSMMNKFDSLIDLKVDEFLHKSLQSFYPDIQNVHIVAVHIRRGDFLSEINVQKGYVVPDKYYFRKVMGLIAKKHFHVLFIVCTDDVFWSKNNIFSLSSRHNVILSPFSPNSPAEDLRLISRANETILSGVSSFGWWGAWLGNGDTYYPLNILSPSSSLKKQFKFNDYFFPHWNYITL